MAISTEHSIVLSGFLRLHNILQRECMLISGMPLSFYLAASSALGKHGIPLKQLSNDLDLPMPAIDAMATALEDYALVYRARTPSNRRAYSLFATMQGTRFCEVTREALHLRIEVLFEAGVSQTLAAVQQQLVTLSQKHQPTNDLFLDFLYALCALQHQVVGIAANHELTVAQIDLLCFIASNQNDTRLGDVSIRLGLPHTTALPALYQLNEIGLLSINESEPGAEQNPVFRLSTAGLHTADAVFAKLNDWDPQSAAALAELFGLLH